MTWICCHKNKIHSVSWVQSMYPYIPIRSSMAGRTNSRIITTSNLILISSINADKDHWWTIKNIKKYLSKKLRRNLKSFRRVNLTSQSNFWKHLSQLLLILRKKESIIHSIWDSILARTNCPKSMVTLKNAVSFLQNLK